MDDKERKELFTQVKSTLYEILKELKVSYTSLLYVSCFTFDSARNFYFDKKSKAPHPQERIELTIKYFNIQTIDSDYRDRLLIVDELFKLCFE
jgi:hypothetical protein